MANNTLNHISDQASDISFDPQGTDWSTDVTNVQTALEKIADYAMSENGLPDASETLKGVLKIATSELVTAGTDDTTAITPKKLKEAQARPAASETVVGVSRYATNPEALAGTIGTAAITPKNLGHVFDTRTAKEDKTGTIKIATSAVAIAGEDDTTAMTPKKVKQAIAQLAPGYDSATESVTGIVRLATTEQALAGDVRNAYAISPYTFKRANATDTKFGTIRLATAAEVTNLSDSDGAITPRNIKGLTATANRLGLVKAVNDVTPGAPLNTVLSAGANVVPSSRKVNNKMLTGDVWLGAGDVDAWSKGEADGRFLKTWDFPQYGSVTQVAHGNDVTFTFQMNSAKFPRISIISKANFGAIDGSMHRFARYHIHHNGQFVGEMSTTMDVWKGGSKGHSWRYQGQGVCTGSWWRMVNPGDTIRIVCVDSSFLEWSEHMITCSN